MAQDPLGIFAKPSNKFVFVGRIVFYDPFIHRYTATDDFILRTSDPKIPYVRIVFRPIWGFDAPSSPSDELIDRKAFNGNRVLWRFHVHFPANSGEEAGCRTNVWQLEERKDGTIVNSKISRFVSVPGASSSDTPAFESLPCYVLERRGWSLYYSAPDGAKSKNAATNPKRPHGEK